MPPLKKLVLFLFVCIVTATLYFKQESTEQEPELQSASQIYRCEPGRIAISEVNLSSRGKLNIATQADGKSLDQEWEGQLESWCLKDTEGKSIIWLSLKIDRLDSNFDISNRSSVKHELESGAYLSLYPRKFSLQALEIPSLDSQNTLQYLSMSKFICSSGTQEGQCQETSPTGEYVAKYDHGEQLKKTFTWTDRFGGSYATTIKHNSQGSTAKMQQSQTSKFANYLGLIQINLVHTESSSAPAGAIAKRLRDYSIALPFDFKNTEKQASSTYQNLNSEELNELISNDSPSGQDFVKMVDLLEHEDDQWVNIESHILNSELNKNTKLWITALSKVNKPEAQKMIIKFINSTENLSSKNFALVALGMSKNPSKDSEDFLQTLRRGDKPEAKTASYSLGIIANQSPRQQELLDSLVKDLNSSEGKELAIVIRSIGNIRGIDSLLLSPYLKHPEIKVRSSAIFALRFAQGSTPLLLKALQEQSTDMSSHAARAIAHQLSDEGTIEQVLSIWRKIPHLKTKKHLIQTLSKHTQLLRKPELKAILEMQLNLEANETVQKLIESKLMEQIQI